MIKQVLEFLILALSRYQSENFFRGRAVNSNVIVKLLGTLEAVLTALPFFSIGKWECGQQLNWSNVSAKEETIIGLLRAFLSAFFGQNCASAHVLPVRELQ